MAYQRTAHGTIAMTRTITAKEEDVAAVVSATVLASGTWSKTTIADGTWDKASVSGGTWTKSNPDDGNWISD